MAKHKVTVTDFGGGEINVEKAILEPLGCEVVGPLRGADAKDQEKLIALTKDADCVITQFSPVTAAVIKAMQKNKIIVRYGIGVDNVDLKAAAAMNIPVCNVPDYCIDEVADHTLAMILAAARQLFPCVNVIKAGQWKLPVPLEALHALKDMTVGLIGLGRIGREVASRLRPFKCRLLAYDPVLDAARIRKDGCEAVSLDDLYAKSDLISLHCPSTEQTRYIINAQSITRMKRGVILVNASRGTLVRTPDLIEALRSGHVAAAALDVTDPEPINPDSPLLTMDNVIITSHIASVSPQAVLKLRTEAALAVARALKGEKPINVVNGVVR